MRCVVEFMYHLAKSGSCFQAVQRGSSGDVWKATLRLRATRAPSGQHPVLKATGRCLIVLSFLRRLALRAFIAAKKPSVKRSVSSCGFGKGVT